MPAVIDRVEPDFSKCPAVKGSGNPTVEAVIDRNGKVQHVKILQPISTCTDEAKFCPAERNGQTLETTMQFTVLIHYV